MFSTAGAYQSSYAYDRNGNITSLSRKADDGSSPLILMDDFTYDYNPNTNQLALVHDAATSGTFTDDIDDQVAELSALGITYDPATESTHNYRYNQIGQLIADQTQEIASIGWTVTGKVKKITRSSTSSQDDIEFQYDPMGNRIVKIVSPKYSPGVINVAGVKKYYYFRDAQGNVMAMYTLENNGSDKDLRLTERDIYGSSRLGLENVDEIIASTDTSHINFNTSQHRQVGDKRYELTNHLGNVLSVVTDRKLPDAAGEPYYLQLDGVNDYSSTTSFDPGLSNALTIETWIKTTAASKTIVQQMPAVFAMGGFSLKLHADGTVQLVGRIGSSTTYYSGSSTTAINDGEWHHVAGVATGTEWKIYVDGVLENTGTSPTISFPSFTTYFLVGRPAVYSPLSYLQADIKEISYWNTSRATQIATDMNTAFNGSEAGLIGYWKFADNTNPSNDKSSGNHDMNLNNGTTFGTQALYVIYKPDVIQYNDYYPFGMQMPGRTFTSSDDYRYGFNGKERDNELKGAKNSYDYGMRMYDPRVGKFLSMDPLTGKYAMLTPYQFASNSPIMNIDIDGMEGYQVIDKQSRTTTMVVDIWYIPKEAANSGQYPIDVKNYEKNLEKEVNDKLFIDKNNCDEIGYYTVKLDIRVHQIISAEDFNKVISRRENPLNSDIILQRKSVGAISIDEIGKATVIGGNSAYGFEYLVSLANIHTALHELFHNFIHNHQNSVNIDPNISSEEGKDPKLIEQAHKEAGGIFVYGINGNKEQDLNQKNIDDALNTLPEKPQTNEEPKTEN